MSESRQPKPVALMLTERVRFGGESGAGIMRNRCAFTSRDMGADWPEAFTFAVVLGWDPDPDEPDEDAMGDMASKFGWDADLVAFLQDAHERFKALADATPSEPTP